METIIIHRPWSKAEWTAFKKELENKDIFYTKQNNTTQARENARSVL